MENRQDKMDWLKFMHFKPNETESDAVYKRLWMRIQENTSPNLPERKVRRISFIWKIAAAIALLVALSSGVYFLTQDFLQEELLVVESGAKSIRTVELPDGTIVKMGANSRFTYPKQFLKKVRRVEVDGLCFFDVKKEVDRPFVVHTSNMDVTVLGTQFEVFSYAPEQMAEVTLLSGKVEINTTSLPQKESQAVTLHPNQKIMLNKENGEIHIKEIDADKSLSWQQTGILSFENEPLSVIIPRIEQWFGCKIIYPETAPDNIRITLKVRTETIDEVLYMISLSTKYKYTKHTNTYELY